MNRLTNIRPCFLVGHSFESQGATSFDKQTEFHYWQKVLFRSNAHYSFKDENNKESYKKAVDSLQFLGALDAIECHFNSFDRHAEGCECLVIENDQNSADLAYFILQEFEKVFPHRKKRHDNGIKWVCKTDRGYSNLKLMKDLGMNRAVIFEPFFGDNAADYIPQFNMIDFISRINRELIKQSLVL